MATASDVVRVLACLGLLSVACLIVASMRPRLFDRTSRWLAAYVFMITLSAFLGTASRIGSDEPLVWYGAPMRLISVVLGLVYIWNTTRKGKMSNPTPAYDEQHSEDGWFDRALKKVMPNSTVMRRFIAAAYILGTISGFVGIRLIERTDTNANRGGEAICAIIRYGDDTLKSLPSNPQAPPDATRRFRKLVTDMRNTQVSCSPPPPTLTK